MYSQLYILLNTVHIVYSAKILTASIFPSYSHQVVYQGVWKELALRGHQVTSITSDPIADPSISNLKEIDISFTYNIWNDKRSAFKHDKHPIDLIAKDVEVFADMSRNILSMPAVQEIIKNSTFDLVIAEWIYPAIFGFSAVFNCPLVGINSIDLLDTLSSDIGNPVHPVVYPGFMLPFKSANTIWERLASVETSLWMQYLFHYIVYPESNEIIKTYIGSDVPSIKDIIRNVSVVFVNSNFLFSKHKGNLPNVIEFSGLHMKKPEPLPKDIQEFLDDGIDGVLYFSLGSYIKSNMLSKELKTIIIEAFDELPYKVLWKFEEENITTSKNIKISKWLPQQDILAHKNVKVFITQGGLQSTEEAIRKRVPMIGIPFMLDQPRNVKEMTNLGIAKYIDKSTVTKETFKLAIIEVAETTAYREKINKLADLLEDEPIKGLDKVIWWIEYVLRHKGAPHLRSPFLDIPWYQYLLLDVLACIIFCIAALFYISILLLKVTLRLAARMQKQKGE